MIFISFTFKIIKITLSKINQQSDHSSMIQKGLNRFQLVVL